LAYLAAAYTPFAINYGDLAEKNFCAVDKFTYTAQE
jgi:hypothetical protein